jgi:hypothetical protein
MNQSRTRTINYAPSSLVNQLVESMLSVSSRLSPHDWAGSILNTSSTSGNIPLKDRKQNKKLNHVKKENVE